MMLQRNSITSVSAYKLAIYMIETVCLGIIEYRAKDRGEMQ